MIYIRVNDSREASYFIRATDSAARVLDGKNNYTVTFPENGLPPVQPERGGFWSLTMYTHDIFMLTDPKKTGCCTTLTSFSPKAPASASPKPPQGRE